MGKWLGVCAALPLVASATAPAQVRQPAQVLRSGIGPSHVADLAALQHPEFIAAKPLANGMLTQKDLSSNAFLGVGLVDMRGRRRDGTDMRAGVPPTISTNPAVTFVVKF